MKPPVIGFAGLSHLGVCSAVAAAARGFDVVGYDGNSTLVAAIEAGRLPVVEPELDDLFAAHRPRLSFHADPGALARCDIVYIARDVPTNADGESDLETVRALIATVAPQLSKTALLVILCQIPPGFTRTVDFDTARLFYQVETLIFGRAMERAQFPERFMVGTRDPSLQLPAVLQTYLGAFDCPILPMRIESAELCKIAINLFLVASVSVSNALAGVAAAIGADWADIVPALRLDRRIGPYAYLTPGLGITGGNLERDIETVLQLAAQTGADAAVIKAFAADSAYRRDWMIRTVLPLLPKEPDIRIALLGIAYKENTDSTKNSPALGLLEAMKGRKVAAYDPAAVLPDPRSPCVTQVESAEIACLDADILVIATPWPSFRDLQLAALTRLMRGRIIVDPFGVLDGDQCLAVGFTYRTLGRVMSNA